MNDSESGDDPFIQERNSLKMTIDAKQRQLEKLHHLKKVFKEERDVYRSWFENLQFIKLQYAKLNCLYNDLLSYSNKTELPHAKPEVQVNNISFPIYLAPRPLGNAFELQNEAESDKFISFDNKIIYFSVPKVASQSILVSLRNYCGGENYIHSKASWQELVEKYPEIGNFFKFTVVRHPYRRLVSCYIDKILNVTLDKNRMLEESSMEKIPSSFVDFVDFVVSCPDKKANSHWASQTSLLSSSGGAFLVDAIVHLENLESELAHLFNRIGLTAPTIHKTKNTKLQHIERISDTFEISENLYDQSYFWSPEVDEKIRQRFQSDYLKFGYVPLSVATISVVICTHNRLEHLRECLQSLADQIEETICARVEVLVVDNASNDDTQSFLEKVCKQYPWLRFIKEGQLGLAHARNSGAESARGTYLCYLDDDARIGTDYLKNLLAVIDEFSPDIVGGPIYPFYTTPKPFWFQDELEIRKYAEDSGFYVDGIISGGNFIIRSSELKRLDRFSPQFGLVGTKLRLGEERELLERYKNSHKTEERKIYYSVVCSVRHYVDPAKMTLSYFAQRAYESGKLKALLGQLRSSGGSHEPDDKILERRKGKKIHLPLRFIFRFAMAIGMFVQNTQLMKKRMLEKNR